MFGRGPAIQARSISIWIPGTLVKTCTQVHGNPSSAELTPHESSPTNELQVSERPWKRKERSPPRLKWNK